MDLPCDRKRRAEGKEGRGGSAGGRDGRSERTKDEKNASRRNPIRDGSRTGGMCLVIANRRAAATGRRKREGGGSVARGRGARGVTMSTPRGGGRTEMTADARRVRARAGDPRSGIGRARARRVGPSSAVLFLRLVQTLRVGVPGSLRRNPAARGNARAVGRATYVIDVRDDGHVADVVLLVHLATELIDGELRREGGVERGGGRVVRARSACATGG